MSRLVAFDLDGTLVDTPRAIVEAFTAAFTAAGVPARDTAAIRATIGMPLEQAFGRLMELPVDDGVVVDCVALYLALFREVILPQAAELVFPQVADGLATLRERGFTLAVATSKYHASADALLRAAALREYFPVVIGADEVARPKPDPEMARTILRRTGVAAAQAFVVGDTTHDLLMARSAGIRSIAVTYGVHSEAELRSADPTFVCHSFADVVAFASGVEPEGQPPEQTPGIRDAVGGHPTLTKEDW